MRRVMMLGVLLGGVVLLLSAASTSGQPPRQPQPLQVQVFDTRDNLYFFSGAGTNTVVLDGLNGVVVIDPKPAGLGQAQLAAIAGLTDKPVTTIINTTADLDHTGGNAEFPPGVEIIAHEHTKENMAKLDAFQGANARFLPTRTFTDRLSLFEGADRIDLYYFGAGHTSGDTIVVFPQKELVYMGDLFADKGAPVIDRANGGSGLAYPDTLAKAAQLSGIGWVVLGHRPIPPGYAISIKDLNRQRGIRLPPSYGARGWITWDNVREYADFTRDFRTAVQDAFKAGKTVDAAAASLNLPAVYKEYGMERAKAAVQAIYSELKP